MSKCDLEIVFERGDRTFEPGDEIKGELRVRVNKNCTCNGLTVSHYWQSHGRGNRATGDKDTQTLYSGPLVAGQQRSYPFSFVAQNGPVTYRGHYLNVDWMIKAQADVPWAIDPKAEEDIVLQPGKNPKDLFLGPAHTLLGTELRQDLSMGCSGLLGMFFFFGGAVWAIATLGITLVGAGMRALFSADFTGFFSVLMAAPVALPGMFFCCIGMAMLFKSFRNRIAQRKLGEVLVKLESDSIQPGQPCAATLSFTPRKSVELGEVKVRLIGEEVVVSGSGTNRTTHRHELHDDITIVDQGSPLRAGQLYKRTFAIAVPSDAPSSFSAPDNDLRWRIELRIDVPKWPDFLQDWRLTVTPGTGSSPLSAEAKEWARKQPKAAQLAGTLLGTSLLPEQESQAGEEPPGEEATHVTLSESSATLSSPLLAVTDGESDALLELIEQLKHAIRTDDERKDMIETLCAMKFSLDINVRRVERTLSSKIGSHLKDGRTIEGKWNEHKVVVHCPPTDNEALDEVDRGAIVSVSCLLIDWDTFYRRPIFESV